MARSARIFSCLALFVALALLAAVPGAARALSFVINNGLDRSLASIG